MKTAKIVRVSSKGQIVLPKRYRDKLDIHEGDYLVVEELADGLLILEKKAQSLIEAITRELREEVKASGFTREDLQKVIKEIRAARDR